MTRLSVSDLSPRMKAQILKKLAEEEKQNKAIQEAIESEKQQQKNGNKYHAEKKTAILPDGTEHTFDSAKEFRVYNDLMIRQKAGEISDLRLQVPYELIPKQIKSNGKAERSVHYIADFVYTEDGKQKVVDVKGYRKGGAYAVFVIKRKLMLWVNGIEVIEM
jgi:GH25 family lysozyme M1 (1,4-beta-N-acetylmuramidase)